MKNPVAIIDETQGQTLSVVGDTYRIIIPGQQTGGEFAVIDMLVPPGGGPGPHAHAGIEESFYVVNGEIEFKTEQGRHIARKGAFVHIPKGGAVHSFKNISNETAHLLCTVIPAGLDALFQEIGTPVAAGEFLPPPKIDEKELNRLKAAAEKYGQELYEGTEKVP